ncbi:TIGR03013 family XrtA/PEP-CTERM system glycosyltransferase [Hydrogenophaga sp.]|uniref:TIGR03013 family XrtA/PEP-CTERM system glycosyltransferase n=1 Tax=Hydrogenophaga sp. TaxID=1904254 RepID=UPI0035665FDD
MIKIFNHYFHRGSLLQIALDLVLISLAVVLALYLESKGVHASAMVFWDGVSRGFVMALGVVSVNSALGFYDGHHKTTTPAMRARAVLSCGVAGFVALGVLLVWPFSAQYSTRWLVLAVMLLTGLLLAHRVLRGPTLPESLIRRKVLVFGTGTRAQSVGKFLKQTSSGVELIGYLASPNEREAEVSAWGILDPNERLTDVVKRHGVDEIVVALSERRGGSMPMRELLDCKLNGVSVSDIATYFEHNLGQIRLDSVSAGWLIFGDGFNQGFVRSLVKRWFDIVGACVLLVVTLPFMLITALAIALESRGPIFYRQPRVGLNGAVFDVVKFRSMRTDAEKDGVPRWASAGDSRITRVGRIIRKVRIDELPQLFSVLKGDMSLVGPRPERPFFVDQLTQEIPYYAVRHSVKPGVTGWAQVSYHYGASVEDTSAKLQYDLYYVKNHSLVLDLVILFETVGVVLTGKGAQ